MSTQGDLQPELRQRADDIVQQLSSSKREALLVKCWISHDARWFMAVAREYGMSVANRLNKIAAHELGKAEAQRVSRALDLTVTTLEDFLLAQEIYIGLLGPDLLDYSVVRVGDNAYQLRVQRCFAHENAVRAGISDEYECGVLARVTGWLEASEFLYEIDPSLEKCLKCQGQECAYTITVVDCG